MLKTRSSLSSLKKVVFNGLEKEKTASTYKLRVLSLDPTPKEAKDRETRRLAAMRHQAPLSNCLSVSGHLVEGESEFHSSLSRSQL
jgi:hypothetical protein